jgi:hypothetical protein
MRESSLFGEISLTNFSLRRIVLPLGIRKSKSKDQKVTLQLRSMKRAQALPRLRIQIAKAR